VLRSLPGRCALVALVSLCSFCAVGVAFMVYVLIGTQLDLNRQKRYARRSDNRPQNAV